jgi:hypothetical protein
MELEESEANTYLDDMIAVLQDGKELLHRSDAQIAVKKLQDVSVNNELCQFEIFMELTYNDLRYSTDNEEHAKSSEDRRIHSQLRESICP